MTVTPHTKPFSEIPAGGLFSFQYKTTEYYVRLAGEVDVKNSVCLRNGDLSRFEPTSEVTYHPNGRIVTDE